MARRFYPRRRVKAKDQCQYNRCYMRMVEKDPNNSITLLGLCAKHTREAAKYLAETAGKNYNA